jgi:hypothetical protein
LGSPKNYVKYRQNIKLKQFSHPQIVTVNEFFGHSLANPKSEIFKVILPFVVCTKILSDLISLYLYIYI